MNRVYRLIHNLFLAAVTVKAFNGVMEIIGGVTLFIYGRRVEREVLTLTNDEIAEFHNDFIAKILIDWAHSFSVSTINFIVFYLWFHGIINLILVVAIYKKRMWAYPFALVLFSVFLAYQSVRVFHNHSLALLLVSVVDFFLIIVTYLEYKRLLIRR